MHTVLVVIIVFRGSKNGSVHLWILSRRQDGETISSLEVQALSSGSLVVKHRSQLSTSSCNGSSVTTLRFCEEQALLLSGHDNGFISIWDIQVGRCSFRIQNLIVVVFMMLEFVPC